MISDPLSLLLVLLRDSQDTCSDTDSLSSSQGRKHYTGPCGSGQDTPQRKISREEMIMLCQEAHQISSSSDPSPPPPPALPVPSPAHGHTPPHHHRHGHKGSPDLTRTIPESQSMTFHPGSAKHHNGILEKSYSLSQLPATAVVAAAAAVSDGRHPSLCSLDSEAKSPKEVKLHSSSSQDSCDNGEKKRSKIKSLFKKKK